MTDIVESRMSAAEQQEAVRELHELYQNAPCGYHSLDTAGLIVRINDTELGWLGYGRDEITGKVRLAELMPPNPRRRIQQVTCSKPMLVRRRPRRCREGMTLPVGDS